MDLLITTLTVVLIIVGVYYGIKLLISLFLLIALGVFLMIECVNDFLKKIKGRRKR